MRGGPCASPSTSPTPASPRAAPPRSSCSPAASTVGGEVVPDPARDVDDASGVAVDGKRASPAPSRASSTRSTSRPGVVSTAQGHAGPADRRRRSCPSRERLYPVGRLDADTTGLILLTNDGELANRLTHPSLRGPADLPRARRQPPVREPALRALRDGVELEDGMTAPAPRAPARAPSEFEMTIHEGRKRQVRRMCEAVGHPVERARARRVRAAAARAGSQPGEHRALGPPRSSAARGSLAMPRPMRLSPSAAPTTVDRERRARRSSPRPTS